MIERLLFLTASMERFCPFFDRALSREHAAEARRLPGQHGVLLPARDALAHPLRAVLPVDGHGVRSASEHERAVPLRCASQASVEVAASVGDEARHRPADGTDAAVLSARG